MKRPGMVGTISLVSGLILAIPMAIIGLEFLGQGRTSMGVGFLALAAALLVFPEFIARRIRRPWSGLTRRLPMVGDDRDR